MKSGQVDSRRQGSLNKFDARVHHLVRKVWVSIDHQPTNANDQASGEIIKCNHHSCPAENSFLSKFAAGCIMSSRPEAWLSLRVNMPEICKLSHDLYGESVGSRSQ